MLSSREAYENDFCPVRDDLLGQMYRANENGLPVLVESVSSDVRAMLALFCYRRSHLHTLALSIAASCEERDLIQSYQLGVNAYVVKPVSFNEFVEVIQDLGIFWAVLNEPPPGSTKARREGTGHER